MTDKAFYRLYLLCLLTCLGAVQVARASLQEEAAPAVMEPQAVVAVPPKPAAGRERPERAGRGVRYDEAMCGSYEGDQRDACYHSLARQRAPRDLDGALEACGVLSSRLLGLECVADVAELHASTDLRAARDVCPTIESRRWRDQCFFGIAMVLVDGPPARALAACDDAGMWRDFCRHDVVGELALRDLEFAMAACAAEDGDLLTRKTCWHGIGKYLGRVDPLRALSACAQVPLGPDGLYRENCVHGAGWALGEAHGVVGAEQCARAGEQAESCLLGVAFQQKFMAPDAARGLCREVRSKDLRSHCLGFLSK